MRIAHLLSGAGTTAEALIRDCATHGGVPVLAISNRPEAAGLAKAAALGVPTATIPHRGRGRDVFEADLHAALAAARPDLICLAGFMRILSPGFVARWPGRMLNLHPSLLPLFPGLDTHARALAAGMAIHGATVHEVTADLDAGPILGQAAIPIRPGDTPGSLEARLKPVERSLYCAVVRARLAGEPLPIAHLAPSAI